MINIAAIFCNVYFFDRSALLPVGTYPKAAVLISNKSFVLWVRSTGIYIVFVRFEFIYKRLGRKSANKSILLLILSCKILLQRSVDKDCFCKLNISFAVFVR